MSGQSWGARAHEEHCFFDTVTQVGCTARAVYKVKVLGWRRRGLPRRQVCARHLPTIVCGLGWPCRVEYLAPFDLTDPLADPSTSVRT